MSKKALKSDELKEEWVDAFQVGKVNDLNGNTHEYSENDLNDLNAGIQSQLKNGYKPPLVKGHPKLDDPRVASIVDSKVEDGKVKVKLDDVNPDFAEETKKGGWKYVSAAVYTNLKKGLRHLGCLGAHAPAMKGMGELCFGEGCFAEIDKGESEVIVFASPFDWDRLVPQSAFESLVWKLKSLGGILRNQREQIIAKDGIEKANELLPDWQVKDMETVDDCLKNSSQFPKQQPPVSPAEGGAPAFADPADGGDGKKNLEPPPSEPNGAKDKNGGPQGNSTGAAPEPDPLKEENAALKAKLEALEAEKLSSARKAEGAAFAERCDRLIGEGRMNGKQKDAFTKVFSALQGVPVDGEGCFGEGDGRVNPVRALSDALDLSPKLVEFGECQVGGAKKDSAAEKINKYKAEQESKGRKISYSEAASEAFKE